MTMTTSRNVWFTDANGAEVDGDVSIERLRHLLLALDGSDEEHATVSVTDSDEWNLEFSIGSVLLENVGPGGEEVGVLPLSGVSDALLVAGELIAGDFAALRARPWAD